MMWSEHRDCGTSVGVICTAPWIPSCEWCLIWDNLCWQLSDDIIHWSGCRGEAVVSWRCCRCSLLWMRSYTLSSPDEIFVWPLTAVSLPWLHRSWFDSRKDGRTNSEYIPDLLQLHLSLALPPFYTSRGEDGGDAVENRSEEVIMWKWLTVRRDWQQRNMQEGCELRREGDWMLGFHKDLQEYIKENKHAVAD